MIISAEHLLTKTLKEKPWGIKSARIMAAALKAVDPVVAVMRVLNVQDQTLFAAEHQYQLEDYDSIYLLSIGKAALPMASAVADLIPGQIRLGLTLAKHGSRLDGFDGSNFTHFQGGHPIPDQNGLESSAKILSQLSNLSRKDLVIITISGGGSALLTVPAQRISLKDIQKSNQVFLEQGLNIQEINTIRKHISKVKGGQLAQHLYPAHTLTLILSDVMGDPADMIASGPTVPDPTTYQDAQKIIDSYQLEKHLPSTVLQHIKTGRDGMIPETPKPGDELFEDQIVQIIAGNNDAIYGGLEQAQLEGFIGHRLEMDLAGEAQLAGRELAKHLLEMADPKQDRPKCTITGGETTVTLSGTSQIGLGGRNLEVALSAVRPLAGVENIALITLATDGEDGVTDAAGAVVTGETLSRAESLGLNPDDFLSNHDSYHFFQALDDLLLPGVTGTNTNDLCFLFNF